MKTRVLLKNGLYYPQYKGLLFWKYFYFELGYKYIDVRSHFANREQAQKYLDIMIAKDKRKV